MCGGVLPECLNIAHYVVPTEDRRDQKRGPDPLVLELYIGGCKLSCGYWVLEPRPSRRTASAINCFSPTFLTIFDH